MGEEGKIRQFPVEVAGAHGETRSPLARNEELADTITAKNNLALDSHDPRMILETLIANTGTLAAMILNLHDHLAAATADDDADD